jgi:2-dehydropantoate 2-reductase
MRVTIMGAGAVGGFYGAKLAHGGCDVGFVARGAHLAAMQEHGLRVESKLGDIYLPQVRASDDPAALGPADYVLLCVKLWDTEAAARALAPTVGPETAVISLQNGVTKDDVLRPILGDKALLGGLCYIGTTIASPGVIRHTGVMQRLVFGEYDGSRPPRATAFLDACKSGGIEAELSADIRRALWEKFAFLVGLSGATTTIRKTVGPIRSNPQTRGFYLDLMREVVAVGRAHGVNVPADWPENRLAFADGLPAEMTSSMHIDLDRGNRLELDWLSGAVVKLGKDVNVPTPLNRAVADILALYANGGQKAESRTA